uniref:EF-hand domain-containing protein n=1 Tax=Oreochromis aureus TaxID=47969 RepID=A0A668UU45_OREAU
MAAFTAPCANTSAMNSMLTHTAWQSQESNDEASTSGNGNVGQNTILEKTHEFFQMCDIENKGFITRRDMQRLNSELPLSAEELENVFDTLDSDNNGYLTLEEFSSGFSSFLFGNTISEEEVMGEKNSLPEVLYQTHTEEGLAKAEEDEEEKHFCMLMESLGANNVFEDPAEVRSLWAQLRRDEPHLLSNFEDFLGRVTSQIREANQEKREMESALKRKAATHDNEIQRLYEEMEQQIKSEKERIVLQDYERFLSRSQDLELQLSRKEKELEQLFQKQKRLESQCQELHSEQHVTKVENVKLKQTNDELAQELEHTSQELMLAQEQLSLLQEQSTRLHEDKEIEIYRITEGLQRERESLLKQLDLLREMNKHLRDERDICYQVCFMCQFHSLDYFNLPSQFILFLSFLKILGQGHLQRIISIEEDHLPSFLYDCQIQTPLQECNGGKKVSDNEDNIDLVMSDIHPRMSSVSHQQSMEKMETPSSPRGQPVGKENSMNVSFEEVSTLAPERLFKIVLVGNSSVGKTCLLRRFCDEAFHPGTSATVGTCTHKYKTLSLFATSSCLSCRYRSITKQFFRKADGVVVMYDITTEESFTAVRQWLTSVKEGAGDDIPVLVTVSQGLCLLDCQMTFYECSACSGYNVVESMVHLARILKEQEDQEKEKTVHLVSIHSEKKRSCC